MAIREIVVREGEVAVKMDGVLTAEDLEYAQQHIYVDEETIGQLQCQTFDFTGVKECNCTPSQIFYLVIMDNSAILTNPNMKLIKIVNSDLMHDICYQWHRQLCCNPNQMAIIWRG